jgi:hypothetical protein
MTLLTMCNTVLSQNGFREYATVVGNSDPGAKQILALANAELKSVSDSYDWPHREVEYTFDTVVDQSAYNLPAAFKALAVDSVFDADQYYRLKGSMPVPQWNMLKYGGWGTLDRTVFKLTYTPATGIWVLNLNPAPTEVLGKVLVYYTKNRALQAGVGQELYTADTNTPLIPEDIVELGLNWRLRRAKGLDFSAELAEYSATIPNRLAQFQALGSIPVGGYQCPELTEGYVPENGYGQ